MYVNFGWALTPQPKIIPFDGSTIHVLIDGQSVGTPIYNNYRGDIATFFPGLANSDGPIGFRFIDTTALAEGQHTIAWIVADAQGAAAGIGSRFFSVANSADAQTKSAAGVEAGLRTESLAAAPLTPSPARVEHVTGEVCRLRARSDGSHSVRLRALERLELRLEQETEGCPATWAGYLADGDTLNGLPVGASVDPSGTFYWQPGPGFLGTYTLLFVRTACDGSKERMRVAVTIGV